MPQAGIMGRQVQLIFEDEEANPSVAVWQKAGKAFEVRQGRFPHRYGQSVRRWRSDRRRARRQADRDHRVLCGFDHRRQMFAQRVPGQRACRPAVGRAGGLGWRNRAEAQVGSSSGPKYEMGVPPSRPQEDGSKGWAPKLGRVEVFAPLDSKTTRKYFGQLRQAKPEGSTPRSRQRHRAPAAQMQDFGLATNLLVVGASAR